MSRKNQEPAEVPSDATSNNEWLRRVINVHKLNNQDVALVLGKNTGRVKEWIDDKRQMPSDCRRLLAQWIENGKPTFPYWAVDSSMRRWEHETFRNQVRNAGQTENNSTENA